MYIIVYIEVLILLSSFSLTISVTSNTVDGWNDGKWTFGADWVMIEVDGGGVFAKWRDGYIWI